MSNKNKKPEPNSTTSLGKKRDQSRRHKSKSKGRGQSSSPRANNPKLEQQPQGSGSSDKANGQTERAQGSDTSIGADYGSQSSMMRRPAGQPGELTKVAVLGAAGGIGQPLSMLLMLHSEYIQQLALYDLAPSVRGIGLEVSHIDRACKVTTHVGPDELAGAVRGAKVIICTAGIAQKPGMSRDDLFGTNAKIMFNLARVCAQEAPQAMLAIVSNPVNSLVPLACEVYGALLGCGGPTSDAPKEAGQQSPQNTTTKSLRSEGRRCAPFNDCFRRIFGVTTLDVVRASSLTVRSALFKQEPNGLFKDPAKVQVPVVGGHAGRTIVPLLSQASPKLDERRLIEDRATVNTLVDSIQQAGIQVLNEKRATGTATQSMAYAACRFTISLLRALAGEPNIVECAFVRHQQPPVHDLDYFSLPMQLGKAGYVKTHGLGKVMSFEQQMVDDAVKELKLSIAKGEDFAKEQMQHEK